MNRDLTGLLDNKLAPSTVKSYKAALLPWLEHTKAKEISSLPAEPLEVANFLASLATSSKSVAKVTVAAAAISDWHKRHFVPSPTQHESVRLLLDAVKRQYSKPVVRRAPITPQVLHAVNESLNNKEISLSRWRTVWRVNIAFYGMLRWDEVSKLRWSDISFRDEKMFLFIRKSKTDQTAAGATVTITANATDPCQCPRDMTIMYFKQLQYSNSAVRKDQANMQPRVQSTSEGQRAIPNTVVSYTTATEDLKTMLAEAGIAPSGYCEHSARRGGATAAAAAGVDWLDLKRHGRWKSDKAAQVYVDDHEQNNDRAAVALAKTVSVSSSASSTDEHRREVKRSDIARTSSTGRKDSRPRHHYSKRTSEVFKYKDELKYEASLKRRAAYKY